MEAGKGVRPQMLPPRCVEGLDWAKRKAGRCRKGALAVLRNSKRVRSKLKMTEIPSLMTSRGRAARGGNWGFMFGRIAIHFTENITWVV